jgi:hypothetical protein
MHCRSNAIFGALFSSGILLCARTATKRHHPTPSSLLVRAFEVGGEITTRYPWREPFQEGVRVARYRPRGGGHEQAICEVIFLYFLLGEAKYHDL